MSFFTQASFVMDPNVYGVGKLYVPKPTDGSGDLTFTRASNGTRVNQDGLIEKVRTNLLLQSNQFDTSWGNNNTTETGGQTDKDGGSTAWLVDSSAAFGSINQGFSAVSGVFTFSVCAKAGTNNWVLLRMLGSTSARAWFNLSSGVLGATDGPAIESKIESVGGGYYRCSISANMTSFGQVLIYPTNADTVVGAIGNIYIQNAQLETGDIATDWIETTTSAVSVGPIANIPRLNYGADGCPSLLLEPQRTNLIKYSEQFDNAAWGKSAVLITPNAATSPDGYLNADKLISTAVSGFHNTGQTIVSKLALTPYTFSFFAKAGEIGYCLPNFSSAFSGTQLTATVNLSDGTVSGVSAGLSASTEDYGNGWWRVLLTATSQNNTSAFLATINTTDANGNGNHTGDGTSGIYVYGAQVEAGAYATSYIPTLSSAVTRVADAAYKTGMTSAIGQTEGTLFADFIMPPAGNLFTHYRISGAGGLYNDSQNISITATNQIRGWSFTGSSTQAQINSGIYAEGTRVKVAYAYKANDFVLYVNGVQIGTDTSGSVPAMSELLIGSYYPDTSLNVLNRTNQFLLFKTRLSNADLARLTSL